MTRRIDLYDAPAAPAPNSLVPSVNVVVANDAGDILMIRRSDNDTWAVPGGAINLGESLSPYRGRPFERRRKRPGSPARSPAWSAPAPTPGT